MNAFCDRLKSKILAADHFLTILIGWLKLTSCGRRCSQSELDLEASNVILTSLPLFLWLGVMNETGAIQKNKSGWMKTLTLCLSSLGLAWWQEMNTHFLKVCVGREDIHRWMASTACFYVPCAGLLFSHGGFSLIAKRCGQNLNERRVKPFQRKKHLWRLVCQLD